MTQKVHCTWGLASPKADCYYFLTRQFKDKNHMQQTPSNLTMYLASFDDETNRTQSEI